MTKPNFKLRLVPRSRPLAALSRAEKIAAAIGYLRSRGRYVLDAGSRRPSWGVPGDPTVKPQKVNYRSAPTFFGRIAEMIKALA